MINSVDFNATVGRLSGIGGKRLKLFEKLGIMNVSDLLYHFPRGYQNRGNVRLLADAPIGEPCSIIMQVATRPHTVMLKNRQTLTKFTAVDPVGRKCTVVFFNNRYAGSTFAVGGEFRFWGKLTKRNGFFELASPIYEACREGEELRKLVPLYPLTEGLTQNVVSGAINDALSRVSFVPDIIPESVRAGRGLVSRGQAFRLIHTPENYGDMEQGRAYFVFEELYIFALGVYLFGSKRKKADAIAPKMSAPTVELDTFKAALPYKLTGAQERTVSEIIADMTNEKRKPMSRLVSGDVGSGKTVCAAAAAYAAIKNGYQAALMVPTEVLARQHYLDMEPLFASFRMTVALLTGSTKAADKRSIYQGLSDGSIDLVIGTHALISDSVSFKSLGLVITDEQHRFGVMQRAALAGKSAGVHKLIMSATPIPRTLAMILYCDLDMSVLDELPPGRQKIGTFVVDESYRERLLGFIRKQVYEGHQVYIVCPAVEARHEDEELEGDILSFDRLDFAASNRLPLKSAVEYSQELKERFPDINIGFMHGRLKPAEKDRVMSEFAENKIQILVSTTVIEVGVNVPNATLMVVENAERFGLSQLHQLRGRVGRGSFKSWCIIVSDTKDEAALARLNVMHETNDGYKIAERDLALRGPGDFFASSTGGVRQHGGFEFKFAHLCDDVVTLKDAFSSASETLAADPDFEDISNREALLFLEKKYSASAETE